MPSKSITTLTLLTLLTTAQTQAQTQAQTFDKSYFLGRTIQSCADVQCPTKGTTTTVSCTLTNETYTNVGVAKIPDTSGLSWVQAIVGKDLETRHFIKDFFLASNNLNVTDGGACALFFTKVSDRVKWVEGTLPVDVSQGTCAQAMSESCVRKLVERAKGVDLRGLAGEQACGKLQTEFKANLDGECAGAVAGTRWMGVEARVLSGAGAPEPITPEQNVSSNCWPVQPKSFDLTRVMRIDTTVCLSVKFYMILC
ncbi:hypothetical protein B0T14DRAFT_249776 [Immersiella caudata]|uniref:Uncharacterized protein n=1 Tax=Immersiella caudata TaxID=314043 RepID=A0AA40BWV5_9PEZI|nr:hypothetical protein B0T14DRAFT_249776 [Immersiella caudata]